MGARPSSLKKYVCVIRNFLFQRASQKASRCLAAAEKARSTNKAAAAAADEARNAVLPIVTERERAESILSNGAQAAEAAAAVTAAARQDERDALLKVQQLERSASTLADKATTEAQAVKVAKRESEELGRRSAESSANERMGFAEIDAAQRVLDAKRAQAASESSF